MRRILYLTLGLSSALLGLIGIVVPGLPTVPFMLLAAFAFSRSSPRLEAWLVDHAHFGPHIREWRARGAISRGGKRMALAAFGASALAGLLFAPMPWMLLPVAAAVIGGSWVWTRPDA